MSDELRQLDWHRFEGAFANVADRRGGDRPVIGVAPDVCPCCDERYVVIAAVDTSGAEVSVSLAPEVALDVAQRILDSYCAVKAASAEALQ